MKALRVDNSGPTSAVIVTEVPQPTPGPGELRIRVCAAGLIPTELSWYPTSHTTTGSPRMGAIPGHEFSGMVDVIGEGAGSFETGAEVYGMNDWYSDGAMAEYCTAPAVGVARKPRSLSHTEAASVPISALTAWQALFDHASLRSGERVLIHGGAGSVGGFAIQFAKFRDAWVAATVSDRDRAFVSGLGADQAIDYHVDRFEDCVKEVDVVLDTVGGETLSRSWGVLRQGGRLVTVVSTAESSHDPRVQKAFFIVQPDRVQLAEIAVLLDSGKLRFAVDTVIALSDAPRAYAGKAPKEGRGKLIVRVAE